MMSGGMAPDIHYFNQNAANLGAEISDYFLQTWASILFSVSFLTPVPDNEYQSPPSR
jgi:hypothetical protein